MRKPFHGVLNILRFNWHFYLLALIIVSVLLIVSPSLQQVMRVLILVLCFAITVTVLTSLFISYLVYDRSDLYDLKWLGQSHLNSAQRILNIHAGFDEITPILRSRFPAATMEILDFYDPSKHTEISIKRARKAYPPPPETKSVATDYLMLQDNSIDTSIVFMSAHEVRNEKERLAFFEELKRVTKPNGQVMITEHLRDFNNFLAYTIGFFHFHSKQTWMSTFSSAGFKIIKEIKTTPFVTTFVIEADGSTY